MKRKHFIKSIGCIGFSSMPTLGIANSLLFQERQPIDLKRIEEFARAGHNDLVKVKSMLEEQHNLLYSRYVWGNGDFEEAIEGAGHVGNKEIARFLIGKGARVNLFVLTMLGETTLVKPVLERFPKLIFAKGPHGFSLLHHANKGGKEAENLKDYQVNRGFAQTKLEI